VPCTILAALVWLIRARSWRLLVGTLCGAALLLALTLLPEALWYAFVRLKTGGFYQYEMQSAGQLVWIADSWRVGVFALASRWLGNMVALLGEARERGGRHRGRR